MTGRPQTNNATPTPLDGVQIRPKKENAMTTEAVMAFFMECAGSSPAPVSAYPITPLPSPDPDCSKAGSRRGIGWPPGGPLPRAASDRLH